MTWSLEDGKLQLTACCSSLGGTTLIVPAACRMCVLPEALMSG
jgi:hypothetical protein